jgi:methylenetetrahydrofolate reductase (NADPH)
MTTMKSKFSQALTSGRLVLTAECVPPRMATSKEIKDLSNALAPSLDAIVVADNPDDVYGSALACAGMLAQEGRTSILSMVTRDRNRVALQSDAMGAYSLGVSGILCLSGNHQSMGVCREAAGACDIDSIQLTKMLKNLELPEMALGEVAHPYQTPLELNIIRLKKKVAAGADFVMTEPVFDLAGFETWMEAVRQAGLDKQTAIIASILPVTSADQAHFLQDRKTYGPIDEDLIDLLTNGADAVKIGLEKAAEIASKVKAVPGVRGIHILCGGNEAVSTDLIAAAKLA